MATNLRSESALYTFRLVGKQGKYFALRAPTWNTVHRNALDAQQFEGEVAGWCMENATGEWHVSSFKETHGYEPMPHAFHTGNALCLLIEQAADLIAFEQVFRVAPDEAAVFAEADA